MTAHEFYSVREPFVVGGAALHQAVALSATVALGALVPHIVTTTAIIIAVVSYLLGSIPFGYLLVRVFRGQDVRQTGSGNIGATNVARTGSKGLAIATLLLDALKGYVAVVLAYRLAGTDMDDPRTGSCS